MSDYGTISDDGTVRLERAFPISVDQLWAYLTTPDGLRRWIAEGQIGPARAQLRLADNGSLIDGAILSWDPPALVEFEWSGGPTQPEGSRVRFELAATAEGSRLTLTHSRTTGRTAPDFAAGWHRHLDTLSHLAHQTPSSPNRPTWEELHQHYGTLTSAR